MHHGLHYLTIHCTHIHITLRRAREQPHRGGGGDEHHAEGAAGAPLRRGAWRLEQPTGRNPRWFLRARAGRQRLPERKCVYVHA